MLNGTSGAYKGEQYYFHGDHLGSSSFITDMAGDVYEHLEYFLYGETWGHQQSGSVSTPYKFTGKELDVETGLYYYGARYYDPRTSVWASPDPILKSYMNGKTNGGVFNPNNLKLFSYTMNNPINLVDPDGKTSANQREIIDKQGKTNIKIDALTKQDREINKEVSGVDSLIMNRYNNGSKNNCQSDCSGGVKDLYEEAGITIRDGSYNQYNDSTKIDNDNIMAGDIAGYKTPNGNQDNITNHIGVVAEPIIRDQNGKVIKYDLIHLNGSAKNWSKNTITPGKGLGKSIVGFGTFQPSTDPIRTNDSFGTKLNKYFRDVFSK